MSEGKNETDYIVFLKNLPKQIHDLTEFYEALQPITQKIKSFGRRRALIYFQNEHEVNEAVTQLHNIELLGKRISATIYKLKNKKTTEMATKEDSSNSNSKVIDGAVQMCQKSTQTFESINEGQAAAMPVISKQLGLVETIYVEGAEPQNVSSFSLMKKSRKLNLSVLPYQYVIAVDFEATCWEKQAPPKWRESEIIEFPAVLVNLKTGKVEAEFHKYIMPIESPKLSAFCTELTGITQKTVDNGIPLQTAFLMFQEWLRKELRARNLMLPKMSKDNKIGNCAFVTWTDWDFGVCLAKECQRKSLKKPTFFNQWIDLRAIYREWYSYRPTNFADALSHVELVFDGRQHSGIDDAKNLAALTYKMISDGATLSLTKDLTPFQLNINCIS